MRLAEAAERSFARHETFHPRYSWFRKAYAHVTDDPRIFSRPDAPVEIGVGKNMVRAIRFWGTAARLIIDDPTNAKGREARCVPTRRGRALFGEGRLGSLHGGSGHAVAAALAAARPEEVHGCRFGGSPSTSSTRSSLPRPTCRPRSRPCSTASPSGTSPTPTPSTRTSAPCCALTPRRTEPAEPASTTCWTARCGN